MLLYLTESEEEAKILRHFKRNMPDGQIKTIGTHAENLSGITDDDVLINIGYATGFNVPAGTLIEPSLVYDYEKDEIARIEPLFLTERRICVTCETFPKEPAFQFPCIYDTSLFNILNVRCKAIHAIKIVNRRYGKTSPEKADLEYAWRQAVTQIARNL